MSDNMDKKKLQHGMFSWNELMTTDPAAAAKFYSDLFGWNTEKAPNAGMDYTIAKVSDVYAAGIMNIPPQCGNMPPCWGAYVTVDNVDATMKKVEELGGKVIAPPMDIPDVGRFSVFADPQGAVLAVITYVKQRND